MRGVEVLFFLTIFLNKKKDFHLFFGSLFSASDQSRTDDIRIFSPPLYQLSYAGLSALDVNTI